MDDSAAPRFHRQPIWWIVLAVINVLFVTLAALNEAKEARLRRELGAAPALSSSAFGTLTQAFKRGPAAGFNRLAYAVAEVVGVFLLCTCTSFLMIIVSFFSGNWIGFRSWSLFFGLSMVFGFLFLSVTGG